MSIRGLLDGIQSHGSALSSWVAGKLWIIPAAIALIAAVVLIRALARHRRDQLQVARAARAEWMARNLHERLRDRLGGPGILLDPVLECAPTIGACEILAADVAAAAKGALADAGGRRGKAKHILRQRLVNGSGAEPALWRQLGALALLDSPVEALKAYKTAAELAPDDPDTQLLLGVLALRTGYLETAETAFRRLIERAGEAGSAARHRARTMLGDVLFARGEPDAAIAIYEEARSEAAALVEREPGTPAMQRDVSIAHDRVAAVHAGQGRVDAALESYRASLAIAEKLATRDPENLEWQRDLSIAHDRIGELMARKGDLESALASYRAALALAEGIVARDPDRATRHWDVSASLDRVGDALLAQGKPQEALAAYRRGLEIAEEAAEAHPERPDWQRDLAVSYHKVGTLEATDGDASEARECLERGRAIIARLDTIAARQAQWRTDLARFDQALKSLGP